MPAPDGPPCAQLARDHAVMRAAVKDAGALALTYFKTDLKKWHKTSNDPVTEADIAIDRLLCDRLMTARPDYGWLSEETEDDRSRIEREHVWIVDPIDGTRAFLKGKPHFTICAALVRHGKSIAGVVFNPATDEFFEAVAGGGARLNGAPIRVSKCGEISGCRMMAYDHTFKHPRWSETSLPEALSKPWPDMEIIERNSVAYRFALVASGAADAALVLSAKNDWDLAAPDLIVREAGGRFTGHDGGAFVYNKNFTRHRSVLAAGPRLYEALYARVGHLVLP